MEINQIRYAQTVASCGSFTNAAEALYIIQPTLSQQIRKLEQEIGFALFERTTKSLQTTDQGRVFLQYAAPLLDAYDTLVNKTKQLRELPDTEIRVGVLPTFTQYSLLDILNQFQTEQKNITINLQIYNSNILLEMLDSGRIDLIIANIPPEKLEEMQKSRNIRPLFQDVIDVVLHEDHPLASKEAINIEDLNGQNLIMLKKHSSIRRHMDRAFQNARIKPARTYECPAIHTLLGMIRSNTGIGFLSSLVARQHIQPPVTTRPLLPAIPTMTAVLYHNDNHNRAIMDQLAAFIADALHQS